MGYSERESGARIERFDQCFEAHFDEVFTFALRRCPIREDAEDLTAETFAVAWRRLERMPERELPWLLGVANGVLRTQRRAERRRFRLAGRLESEPTDHASRDHAEHVGEREAAARAFSALTDSQREVLQLVAWEGLSNEDAATALGCSHAAFRVRLHRARREMAKQLAQAGHVPDERQADPTPAPQEAR